VQSAINQLNRMIDYLGTLKASKIVSVPNNDASVFVNVLGELQLYDHVNITHNLTHWNYALIT
jgi:hypothetical protein